jgi:Ser/Thr protein kinase RdoA (MazF antagonist)
MANIIFDEIVEQVKTLKTDELWQLREVADKLWHERFTQVAQIALDYYNLHEVQLKFLGDSEHITFRVDVAAEIDEFDADIDNDGYRKGRYLLRIHKPSWYGVQNSEALINSELLWLTALRRDTDLLVPQPVCNQWGNWITPISIEGFEEPRLCTLLRWIPGESPDYHLNQIQFRQIGKILAQLHQHGAQWSFPQGFLRPKFGKESLHELLKEKAFEGGVSFDEAEQFSEMINELRENQEFFGLIHADFRIWNILFHQGEACIIDFARCGFGYYLYDIALFLNEASGAQEDSRQAFLDGYQSVRPLPHDYASYLEMFLALDEMYPQYQTIQVVHRKRRTNS